MKVVVSSNEIQWLTSAGGSQRVGVRVVGDSDAPNVQLFAADASLVATLHAGAAAELVRQLQTAVDFADTVGHDRFRLKFGPESDDSQ